MKKSIRRFIMSMFVVLLSGLAMIATTFAWVGIVSNGSFEMISISLETDNEDSDYGIQLSLSGKKGTFTDNIQSIDLERQILKNMGWSGDLSSDSSVSSIFNNIRLSQVTTIKDFDSNECYYLDPFTSIDGFETSAYIGNKKRTDLKGYFQFDIYVSIYKIGDDTATSDKNLSIYLRNDGDGNGVLYSDNTTTYIANDVLYPTTGINANKYLLDSNNFSLGTIIQGNVNTNPAAASRLAVQKAAPVDLYDVNSVSTYTGMKIYQSGSTYPTYDSKNNIYDFGGVLPNDVNFAVMQYNSTHSTDEKLGDVPALALPDKRGDIQFKDDGIVNHIVDESDHVTTNRMVKLTFSFWFEGWDSDCFEAINNQMVNISLRFSTKNPNEV